MVSASGAVTVATNALRLRSDRSAAIKCVVAAYQFAATMAADVRGARRPPGSSSGNLRSVSVSPEGRMCHPVLSGTWAAKWQTGASKATKVAARVGRITFKAGAGNIRLASTRYNLLG